MSLSFNTKTKRGNVSLPSSIILFESYTRSLYIDDFGSHQKTPLMVLPFLRINILKYLLVCGRTKDARFSTGFTVGKNDSIEQVSFALNFFLSKLPVIVCLFVYFCGHLLLKEMGYL